MVKYAMVVDLERCVGCHTCSIACKSAYDVPDESGRSWVRRLGPEKTPHGVAHTFYPGRCCHCERPRCVPVCPVDKVEKAFSNPSGKGVTRQEVSAIYRDPLNGTVQVDGGRCTGCGACLRACPYDALYLREGGDGRKIADKCDFCLSLAPKGRPPVCVAACPADALYFGDLDDPQSVVNAYLAKGAEGLASPQVRIGPKVYFWGGEADLYLLKRRAAPKG